MNKRFRQVPITLELTTTSAEQQEIQQKEKHAAQLYDNGQRKIVRYEQVEEQGSIHNTIIITDREVKVIRHGVIEMNQAFRLGETTTGVYQTRYGVLNMETKTRSCSVELEEGSGRITLEYGLKINGQWADRLTLRIDYIVKRE